MAASNRLDFGLGGGMNVDGSEYPGYGMDRGLPDFLISFLVGVVFRQEKVSLVLVVRQQMCLLSH